ncbi:MAG: histidine phosphatase family protein [Cetobacterium sp.]|uniref:histidine phosphatase family protein n=1 Tax=unclassified Cetobacterium TaxID=2630983 RepID=UPI00163D3966|nr:histidine phosphatase family protein [Cetobacterium sp. 2A]MBC2855842.1 histidine phosphatase family protein [Cetobacterium sp. 2A]
MGKLILVRHGETELNAKGVYFGILDPPLNKVGVSQAEKSRIRLSELSYDKIWTSDLKRASETANIINHKEYEIEHSSKLRELNFGIFEGYKYEELKVKYPNELKRCEEEWETYNYENGESVNDLQNRAVNFIEENIDFEKTTVVVTHWGIINVILSYYFSKGLESYWKFSVENGGIVVIEFLNGFPILKGLNVGG